MLDVLIFRLSFSVTNPYLSSVNKNTDMSHLVFHLSACFFFWGGGKGRAGCVCVHAYAYGILGLGGTIKGGVHIRLKKY